MTALGNCRDWGRHTCEDCNDAESRFWGYQSPTFHTHTYQPLGHKVACVLNVLGSWLYVEIFLNFFLHS